MKLAQFTREDWLLLATILLGSAILVVAIVVL